ncbi:MAG: hypothetical protein DI537_19175 [Stutzerimonas stutzeri]|nr:MAG: hypothetical protein DI537_19175 [Stutzerimonas stutzeri]
MADSRNYTVGRGEVHFAQFLPGTQTPGPYRYLGNTPEFNLTLESTKLDHYGSDRGIREKDASITIEVARSGTLVCDEIKIENVALFFFGAAERITQAGAAVVDEQINNVVLGHSYQLGQTDSNPIGAKMVAFPGTGPTLFAVKDTATPTAATFVAGTDYVFDAERGWLTILDGGSIEDGDDLRVSYTTLAAAYDRVRSGANAVEGAMKFITFNPVGKQFDYSFPFVTISPNGDFALKGEEWQQIPFSLEILRKGSLEGVYVNGQPFTAP